MHVPVLAQVLSFDDAGLALVQLWKPIGGIGSASTAGMQGDFIAVLDGEGNRVCNDESYSQPLPEEIRTFGRFAVGDLRKLSVHGNARVSRWTGEFHHYYVCGCNLIALYPQPNALCLSIRYGMAQRTTWPLLAASARPWGPS
jgi:hypothetical protein